MKIIITLVWALLIFFVFYYTLHIIMSSIEHKKRMKELEDIENIKDPIEQFKRLMAYNEKYRK